MHADVGLAELGDAGVLDGAAEVLRHQLHPVADAERRHAELVDARIDPGSSRGVHRGGAAAEDERQRVPRPHLLRRHAVTDELGVDAALTNTPRDQLRVLAAEVEDENRTLFGRRLGGGEPDDLPHYARR